jgi:RNA polymerase sigma-70 factor (ECF subfamily)
VTEQASQKERDEALLIEGMLKDDASAWRAFNERYARLLYGCITRITSRFASIVGQDDVREIYAMLCVQLLANDKHKLRSFEPARGNRLATWLGMLAIHTTYDYLRSVKREPQRAALAEADTVSHPAPDPCEHAVWRERAEIVAEVLATFSDKDREFVSLYYGEGLAPEKIADRLGISIKTVYSKKHKIRSRLEVLLGERRLAA